MYYASSKNMLNHDLRAATLSNRYIPRGSPVSHAVAAMFSVTNRQATNSYRNHWPMIY